MVGEETCQQMRTLDEHLDYLLTIFAMGMLCKVREMALCFFVDAFPGTLEQGLIEVTIAQFMGKFADGRIGFTSNRNDAIQKCPKCSVAARLLGSDMTHAPSQDLNDTGC